MKDKIIDFLSHFCTKNDTACAYLTFAAATSVVLVVETLVYG